METVRTIAAGSGQFKDLHHEEFEYLSDKRKDLMQVEEKEIVKYIPTPQSKIFKIFG